MRESDDTAPSSGYERQFFINGVAKMERNPLSTNTDRPNTFISKVTLQGHELLAQY